MLQYSLSSITDVPLRSDDPNPTPPKTITHAMDELIFHTEREWSRLSVTDCGSVSYNRMKY